MPVEKYPRKEFFSSRMKSFEILVQISEISIILSNVIIDGELLQNYFAKDM